MELQITVSYIELHQKYELRSDFIETLQFLDLRPIGYRFMTVGPVTMHSYKRKRSFKVFTSIREAIMDACSSSWITNDDVYQIDEKLDYLEINGVRHKPEDIPKILNFI